MAQKLPKKKGQEWAKKTPKRVQNDAETTQKDAKNDAKTIPKCHQNDPKSTHKWSEITPKTPQKVVLFWSKKAPKMAPDRVKYDLKTVKNRSKLTKKNVQTWYGPS